MNGMEKLREYADATKWGGECRILHEHHGDFAGDCSERECNECRAAYLRAIADEAQESMRDAEARLMPGGMEWLLDVWPKWDNGDYCKFGDWWTAESYGEFEPKQLRKLSIYTPEQLDEFGQGNGKDYGYEWDFFRPSYVTYHPVKVEPPAPKVLDADGLSIEIGKVYYGKSGGAAWLVEGIDASRTHPVLARNASKGAKGLKGEWLTLEPPVIAADGKPLRVGETVWVTEPPYSQYTVRDVRDGHVNFDDAISADYPADKLTHQRPVLDAGGVPIKVGDTVFRKSDGREFEVTGIDGAFDIRVKDESMEIGVWTTPWRFTHTKPEPHDSWERLEGDAGKNPFDYCNDVGHRIDTCENSEAYKARDLVRRAKKLAGVER